MRGYRTVITVLALVVPLSVTSMVESLASHNQTDLDPIVPGGTLSNGWGTGFGSTLGSSSVTIQGIPVTMFMGWSLFG